VLAIEPVSAANREADSVWNHRHPGPHLSNKVDACLVLDVSRRPVAAKIGPKYVRDHLDEIEYTF